MLAAKLYALAVTGTASTYERPATTCYPLIRSMTGCTHRALALSLLELACTPAASTAQPVLEPDPPELAPLPPTTERSIASTVELHIGTTPVTCSWGSSGVVSPDAPIPYWVVGTVDVSSEIVLSDLSIRSLLLTDDRGHRLGEADREFELRISTPERDERDLSRHGTSPLTEPLAPRTIHRLWFRARMSERFSPERGTPARYTLILRAGSADASIEGRVGPPWPTA